MSSDYGSAQERILSDSERTKEVWNELRHDFELKVNGHTIRAGELDGHYFVTVDGQPFAGSTVDAIQAIGKLYPWRP